MSPSSGSLSIAPWVLLAQMSWGMDAVPVYTLARPPSRAGVEVRDPAGLLGPGAERRARQAWGRIRRGRRIPVVVEAVRTLGGGRIAEVARRRAGAGDRGRLYILLAGDEREVAVIGARHGPAGLLSARQGEDIRRAFLGPLARGEADRALEPGIRAIDAALAGPSGPGRDPGRAPAPATLLAAALALMASSRAPGWRRRRRRAAPSAAATSRGR